MTIKKRFIAGARCMKCNAMDRVMIFIAKDDEWIECVDCGYTERRPTATELTNSPSNREEVGVVQFKPIR